MTTRLKIDLSQGILEVEGSESFVRTIYSDFKAQFITPEGSEPDELSLSSRRRGVRKLAAKLKVEAPPPPAEVIEVTAPPEPAATPTPPPIPAEEPLPPKAVPPGPTYHRIANLDLGATATHPSLVEFMDFKLPITNEERNLVFIYFLQHVIHLKSITIDHVYTCYREVNIRAPLNLEHSLQTTNQKGWIKSNKDNKMSVTPEGKLYVETQLPKKVKG